MKLTLRNFTAHRNTELELARVNIITGPNGAGKSSIAYALQLALTGRCDALPNKKDLQRLIRHGEGSATVELQINDFKIARTISRSGTATVAWLNGKRKRLTESEATSQVSERLHTSLPSISLLVSSRLPGEVSAQAIRHHATACLGAQPSPALLKKVAAAELNREIQQSEEFSRILEVAASRATLPELHRTAVEIRRGLKRAVQELRSAIPPARIQLGDREVDLAGVDPEQIRRKIEALQRERDRALLAKQALERKASLEQQIKQLEVQLRSGKKGKLHAREAELIKIRESLRNLVKELTVRVELTELLLKKNECPLVRAPCPRLKEAPRSTDQAEDRLMETLQELEKARQELLAAEEELKEVQAALAAEESQVQLKERLQALRKELQELKQIQPRDPKQLEERIARGRRLLEAVTRYRDAERIRQQITELERKIEHAEKLVSFVAPGGPVEREIARRLEHFRAAFNETARRLHLPVELDPQLELRSTNGILSRSEQHATVAAMKIALARCTGASLLILDDMEMFDGEHKAAILKELHALPGCCSLILATADQPPRGSKLSDIRSFYVDGGNITEIS